MTRLARWCFTRRRTVLAAWLLILVVALGAARVAGGAFSSSLSLPGTGSQAAVSLLAQHYPAAAGETGQVVIQATGGATVGSAQVRGPVTRALVRVSAVPGIASVASPYAAAGAAPVRRPDRVPGAARPVRARRQLPRRPVRRSRRHAVLATLCPATAPQDQRTITPASTLRDTLIPRAGHGSSLVAHVGGQAATAIDFAHDLGSKLPQFVAVVAVVVILAFIMLAAVSRSPLIPLTASALNLISVVAALGAITAVFTKGRGASLLGLPGTGPRYKWTWQAGICDQRLRAGSAR